MLLLRSVVLMASWNSMVRLRPLRLVPLIALAVWAAVTPVAAAQRDRQDERLAELAAEAVIQTGQFTIYDDVRVIIQNREATLRGRVITDSKRDQFAAAVSKIDGLREVRNELRVLPSTPLDVSLRNRVAQAIYSHPSFWRYASMAYPPIHVIVEHGRISLTGVVATATERALAQSLAQVDGSFGVTNELEVTP